MRNRAVEHNVAAFSELSFAVCWQGRLVLQITASFKSGSLSTGCVGIQLGPRKLAVIQSREVAVKRGFLNYYSEWRCSREQGECPL